ncbi:MAG TPA: TonB-dependent receptor [Planctomycetia bacterium]|nr:TonB-dependent receptor [Planctomycetia bacterium]
MSAASPTFEREKLDTHAKALRVNIDARRYGTFAEIGAGQEVVRWFFRVGGAASTIAKSMSAYDMAVSDAVYGNTERYVSRRRLESMLEHEHSLNVERLAEGRGDTTSFFAFADTVSARNFKGTNECHGWMGVRFQVYPRDQNSQIIIHVRMLDTENILQQEALGIVGVNLLYGAFFLHHEPEQLVESLLDSLTTRRVEIDMIEFSGIGFRGVDNRLMSLKLVQLGLSGAAMFDASGAVLQPSEVFYKRPAIIERGSFRPVTHVNLDMLRCAKEKFAETLPPDDRDKIVPVMEITMRNLMSASASGADRKDFLARADVLAACGMTVLISDYSEYYRLAAYLRAFNPRALALVMGRPSLSELFEPKYYEHLDGGILESFGRLFQRDLKLYVYPSLDRETGEIKTAELLELSPDLQQLYEYLQIKDWIVSLQDYKREYLTIWSREVLKRIEKSESGWEESVPDEVAEIIKQRGLFGWNRHRR